MTNIYKIKPNVLDRLQRTRKDRFLFQVPTKAVTLAHGDVWHHGSQGCGPIIWETVGGVKRAGRLPISVTPKDFVLIAQR